MKKVYHFVWSPPSSFPWIPKNNKSATIQSIYVDTRKGFFLAFYCHLPQLEQIIKYSFHPCGSCNCSSFYKKLYKNCIVFIPPCCPGCGGLQIKFDEMVLVGGPHIYIYIFNRYVSGQLRTWLPKRIEL